MTRIINGDFDVSGITIAQAELNDGQRIHGVNDIFIGPRSHISFRCGISHEGREENQSSSGIIVSTGCGSTGWFRSIIEGARRVSSGFDGTRDRERAEPLSLGRGPSLLQRSGALREQDLAVRKSPSAGSPHRQPLTVTSHMPQNGVIFSDGIESDFLEFNSGRIATIYPSDRKAKLVLK